jgi:hypothetical protein
LTNKSKFANLFLEKIYRKGGIMKAWHSGEFKEEIMRLRDGLLNFCLLWGLIFGKDDIRRNEEEEDIEYCIRFTEEEFPRRHPELHFEKVFGTLIHVATSYERGVFIVRPEINTIYSYFRGGKHDLITPIIIALANDCHLGFFHLYPLN